VLNYPNLIREVLFTKGKSFRKWETFADWGPSMWRARCRLEPRSVN